MARVLMSEHPDLHVTLIDLPAFASRQDVEDVLLRELRAAAAHEQVAYRKGSRYVARLRSETASGNLPNGQERLSAKAAGKLPDRLPPDSEATDDWVPGQDTTIHFPEIVEILIMFVGDPGIPSNVSIH